jgi:ABC-type branched-subunit amino acid transport system substrate-binding protein
VRVVTVDTHGPDPGASVGALRSLGARLLAAPCGPPEAVAAVERAATAAGLPLLGGDTTRAPWVWPTAPAPAVEGTAMARQLARQGGRKPLLVVGHGPREQAVASATSAALAKAGTQVPSLPLGDPAATAAQIRATEPDLVVFALSAGEAPPLLQALANTDPGWGPVHGALATSSMMSATVASGGGDWFKEGRVSLTSEVNPSDGTSLEYATRLQQLFPGRHPSVAGVRGYVTGWLIANVLHRAPEATPTAVRRVLGGPLHSFVFGPTRLSWAGGDGGAQSVAFFRTVFTNPLALAGLPGQVGHSGVFLGQGAFVQVTPWSDR